MEQTLTLPKLQSVLDRLWDGQQLTMAHKQIEALFGANDAGAGRLRRFASGHHCIIAHGNDCVVFEKRLPC